jgi:signal peptidase II
VKAKIIVANLVALLWLAADRYLKTYLLENPDTTWDFILFKIQLWQNKGMAFGLGEASVIISTILAPAMVLIIVVLILDLIKNYKKRNLVEAYFLTLVIFGAISNLMDRLIYQRVTDYISFNFWPVFNLADVMIVAGIIGTIANLLYQNYRQKD